ncbi:MAG: hypothetical protein JXB48_24170 [Candidatus Latescibacteria bacterium]|nr:hypothetical protein [Candidatus Latescibacterota bacterium]
MKMHILITPAIIFFSSQHSYTEIDSIFINPFAIPAAAEAFIKGKSRDTFLHEIQTFYNETQNDTLLSNNVKARNNALMAEASRILGNESTVVYYKKALQLDLINPGLELLFARYLSLYRGPGRPLAIEADRHIWASYKKLLFLDPSRFTDTLVKRIIHDQLLDLLLRCHESDGVLLGPCNPFYKSKPTFRLFLSTRGTYGRNSNDFERIDDLRSFTAEAITIVSRKPTNSYLLSEIVRNKIQYLVETQARLRLPIPIALDLLYNYRFIGNGQITNFYEPYTYNNDTIKESGGRIGTTARLYQSIDTHSEITYKYLQRTGLIEFHPDTMETVNHIEGKCDIGWNVHCDRMLLNSVGVFQKIHSLSIWYKRERIIGAMNLDYQHYGESIMTERAHRGSIAGIGFALDKEWYNDTAVTKYDFYVKAALKGLGPCDITLQPSLLTYNKDFDIIQDNLFMRNALFLLLRIKDEENRGGLTIKYLPDSSVSEKSRCVIKSKYRSLPHIRYLHLVFPVSHEFSIRGVMNYANIKIGGELYFRFFEPIQGTSFLVNMGYSFQDFYHLDKILHNFRFSFTVG